MLLLEVLLLLELLLLRSRARVLRAVLLLQHSILNG